MLRNENELPYKYSESIYYSENNAVFCFSIDVRNVHVHAPRIVAERVDDKQQWAYQEAREPAKVLTAVETGNGIVFSVKHTSTIFYFCSKKFQNVKVCCVVLQ